MCFVLFDFAETTLDELVDSMLRFDIADNDTFKIGQFHGADVFVGRQSDNKIEFRDQSPNIRLPTGVQFFTNFISI